MIGQVTPPELKRRLDSGEALVVLDVREPDERAYCRLPVPAPVVDLHVPIRYVPARLEEIRARADGGPIVVYCHHGVRSMVAATWLIELGLTQVMNLDGGIDAWSCEVDPSVSRY